jgi:hypothetical protein
MHDDAFAHAPLDGHVRLDLTFTLDGCARIGRALLFTADALEHLPQFGQLGAVGLAGTLRETTLLRDHAREVAAEIDAHRDRVEAARVDKLASVRRARRNRKAQAEATLR